MIQIAAHHSVNFIPILQNNKNNNAKEIQGLSVIYLVGITKIVNDY